MTQIEKKLSIWDLASTGLDALINNREVSTEILLERPFSTEDRKLLATIIETDANREVLRTAKLLASLKIAQASDLSHQHLMKMADKIRIFQYELRERNITAFEELVKEESSFFKAEREVQLHSFFHSMTLEEIYLCVDYLRLEAENPSQLRKLFEHYWSRFTVVDLTREIAIFSTLGSNELPRQMFLGLCDAVDKQSHQLGDWKLEISNSEAMKLFCGNFSHRKFSKLTIGFIVNKIDRGALLKLDQFLKISPTPTISITAIDPNGRTFPYFVA